MKQSYREVKNYTKMQQMMNYNKWRFSNAYRK